jgi:hypothetical protein
MTTEVDVTIMEVVAVKVPLYTHAATITGSAILLTGCMILLAALLIGWRRR